MVERATYVRAGVRRTLESVRRSPPPAAEPQLLCVECGARSLPLALAEGSGAYLTDDDQLVIYCPFCAWREFGPHRGGSEPDE
jgi:hypothetical protein